MAEESAQQPTGELEAAPAANRRASPKSATKASEIQHLYQQQQQCQPMVSEKAPLSDNKKQWFLLILAATSLLISLILTAYIFSTTHDWRGFIPAPFVVLLTEILRRLYLYYFPPSAEEYKLKELKLRLKFASAQKNNRGQMKPKVER